MKPGDSLEEGSSQDFSDGKDEFGGFGTTSSGISHIFKDGKLGEGRTRIAIVVAALLMIGGAAYFYFFEQQQGPDDFMVAEDTADKDKEHTPEAEIKEKPETPEEGKDTKAETPAKEKAKDAEKSLAAAAPEAAQHEQAQAHEQTHEGVQAEEQSLPKGAVATEAPVVVGPENGSVRNYDESSENADFSWHSGGSAHVLFSRNQNMKPVAYKVTARKSPLSYKRLEPGVWYWQVVNAAGKSEVKTIKINPPVSRKIALANPAADGAVLAGNGGMVVWTGDNLVSYYRLELSENDWANPPYRFATSGTQIAIKDVKQGQYKMRLGAFSEVSGRWEYTDPIKVTVQ